MADVIAGQFLKEAKESSNFSQPQREIFERLEARLEKKDFHGLTQILLEYFNEHNDGSAREARESVFNQLVRRLKTFINQRSYVQLSIYTKRTLRSPKLKLEFAQSILDEISASSHTEAYLFAHSSVADSYIECEEYDKAREIIQESQKRLDTLDDVENIVRAYFFKVTALYHKKKSDFSSFYKAFFHFLACVKLETIPENEKAGYARDLIIYALLSDSIYNFGELLMHPLLESLDSTAEDRNLFDLLKAVNAGETANFGNLIDKVANSFNQVGSGDAVSRIREKVALAAMMELSLAQPPTSRDISFSAIQSACGLSSVDKVEDLVMKAFSLGLVKGTIDEIDQVAHIGWVHPRAMTNLQIEDMRSRLRQWSAHVGGMSEWVDKKGQSVWVD